MHEYISFARLSENAILPTRAHLGDAGIDMYAAESVLIAPGAQASVGLGVAVEIPEGYVGLLHPRSGNAAKFGVGQTNGVGVVDHGYAGEVRTVLRNHGTEPFVVTIGMRVAQLVVVPFLCLPVREVEFLGETARGTGGFGSTGS